ncbi:RPA family protein [Salarchaeum japonicum]|uniref:RPA family protein n=1 Tax=Salarchaeum japonicum TaxID=555573 RepID=UPI003C73F4A2
MSSNSSPDDRPSREVAWRVFAAEFDDADYSYAESDEERAPNYVVTPTGARVNRLFVVGVLTEVEQVSDDVLRARIVDPTGAFVVYAGQYQPDALASLERLDAPAFVAITGKARTFEPDDADTVYTSVRPESISEVDADTRDRWVVRTAEQTTERVGVLADALGREERGSDLRDALADTGVRPDLAAGVPLAIDHYGTTETYLDDLRTVARQAAEVVAGDRDEVDATTPAPDAGGAVDADLSADLDIEAEQTDETGAESEPAEEPESKSESESESEPAEEPESKSESESESEPTTESETTEPEAEPEAGSEPESDAESAVDSEPASEPETESEPEPDSEELSAVEAEPDAADAGDVGTTEELAESTAPEPEAVEPESAESESLGDFESTDEMYEFDEEEREEIEEEFDMDFSSGDDIPEAGEAGIEPETDEELDDADDESLDADDESLDADDEWEEETAEDENVFEGDLEDFVVDTMDDLDGGDGVDRDEVIRTVVEATDADSGDVEDAIQSALMSGRCYESGEDTLKAI